jgi:hypothetical protein
VATRHVRHNLKDKHDKHARARAINQGKPSWRALCDLHPKIIGGGKLCCLDSCRVRANPNRAAWKMTVNHQCSNWVGVADRRARHKAPQFIAQIASGTAMLLNLQNPLTRLSRVRRRWLIARSRIFDRDWYLAEYPEIGVTGLDPIMHYLLSGADRGYRPHLLFDPAWYKNARGPRQRDQNPLIDYINYGAREGIDPSPYFATAFYRKAAGGTGAMSPLGHFVAYGLRRGLAPTPLFDRGWSRKGMQGMYGKVLRASALKESHRKD